MTEPDSTLLLIEPDSVSALGAGSGGVPLVANEIAGPQNAASAPTATISLKNDTVREDLHM